VTPLAAVNLEPPFAQFAPAGSEAEVTLTPFVPLVPFCPGGPVWFQLIWVALFGHAFVGAEPIATFVIEPPWRQPV
jgi:hypothetical protein